MTTPEQAIWQDITDMMVAVQKTPPPIPTAARSTAARSNTTKSRIDRPAQKILPRKTHLTPVSSPAYAEPVTVVIPPKQLAALLCNPMMRAGR